MKFRLFTFFILFTYCFFLLTSCTYYFGKNTLISGENFDPDLTVELFDESFRTTIDFDKNHPLIGHWANRPLPDWKEQGKVSAPRILIAKLLQGKDIEEVNQYILQQEPWGRSGTRWFLNPNGDYDFTEIPMLILLYLFDDKPDLLYPETREHIVHHLLTHSGSRQVVKTPRTLSIMRETENHILMGEVSRYLKNQWLYNNHGDAAYHNKTNGQEDWIVNHLEELLKGGFFEFNSLPYSGYSINAILTLHAFTESTRVRKAAEKLLNQMVIEYGYSSFHLRRYPPFRRQFKRAALKTFDHDPMTAVLRVWLELHEGEKSSKPYQLKHFSLPALVLKYRLSPQLAEHVTRQSHHYLVSIGRGHRSTPEIYSGGPGYLISAGGAFRGKVTQIIARPTTLFLADGVDHIDSCFHIAGNGEMRNRNNTGVYRGFACGNSQVHIPPQYKPAAQIENWQIFETPQTFMYVITYNQPNLGLLFIAHENYKSPREILTDMITQNRQSNLHQNVITFEGDTIFYDVNASSRFEVIQQVNDKKMGRRLADFGRFDVHLFDLYR